MARRTRKATPGATTAHKHRRLLLLVPGKHKARPLSSCSVEVQHEEEANALQPPDRGIFQSDAGPGQRAYVVYTQGKRRMRVEIAADEDSQDAIDFLSGILLKHDRAPRLVK